MLRYIAAVWVLAGSLGAATIVVSELPTEWGAVVVLVILAVASRLPRRNEVSVKVGLSLISVILLAAIPIIGPFGAWLVGLASSLADLRRLPKSAIAFNAAMFATVGATGGLAFTLVGGAATIHDAMGPAELLTTLALPLAVADVVQCVVNAALLSGVIHLAQRIPFRAQMSSLLVTSGAMYVAYGVVALMLAILWVPAGVGFFSAILIGAPLAVAGWAFTQFGDERNAHDRTLGALVASVELKSPGSVGHSDVVARLSGWVAEELALSPKEVEAIQTAGRLHDVGLLALPTGWLEPTRVLTAREGTELDRHPQAAIELLSGISFVNASLAGIAHHHERFDGTGRPDGLAGEHIPLAARVVAVADGFQALTSARLDRADLDAPTALGRMAALAGTAYDPVVVAALTRAVARRSATAWRTEGVPAATGSAVAHDEPPLPW